MDIKEIRVNLGRVKTCYQRNETDRAFASLIMAIKGMGNKPFPSDIRSMIREAVQLISKDPTIIEAIGKPLVYTPGQEQAILAGAAKAYKLLRGAVGAESHEEAIKRKVSIDQHLNQGMKFLEQNKISEADDYFSKAITFYKDEHFLFVFIGKALMEADQIRRALPYLKRATDVDPKNEKTKALFNKCMELRANLQK